MRIETFELNELKRGKIISNHISPYDANIKCTTESSIVGTGRFKNGTDKRIMKQVFFFPRESLGQ